jgi:lipopolysaccharide transport system ATP-binding protein
MTILKATNISKQYRLGLVGTGTLSHDLNRWWHWVRGKDDPFLKVGETNDRSTKGSSDYVWALQDINFEVKQGEVLGIIGKNGAGKSTLLKILSRVTSPSTGEIKTKGRIASLLEVGTGFHPELTGRENIYLNGAILGMTKAEIKAKEDEIISFSGCERYVDTPVKRYSSGMRVRLAFAVAAHLEPDILVIDEVLAVGDAEFQKKAIGKMQDISKTDGRTVLFVSHDMAAIQMLCSRLIVLTNGLVSYEGDVEKGIDYYLSNIDNIKIDYFNEFVVNGIRSINFLNKDLEPIKSISVGQKVSIKVEYVNESERDLSLSIGFFDSFGNFKFACRSDIVNKVFNDKKGLAVLYIEKWPLSEGLYYYNLAVHDKSTMLESVKEAGSINTERGDYYGTGKLPGNKKGFYIDYIWT